MFSNLRSKLFAVFLLYSLLAISVFLLSDFFSKEKEKTDLVEHQLTSLYVNSLQDFKTIDDYFTFDTKNDEYFISGKSKYFEIHDKKISEIQSEINRLYSGKTNAEFNIDTLLQKIDFQFEIYLSDLDKIEKLINKRGYKDYGFEGKMRDYIHAIENFENIDKASLLLIRRHEKDYIIRNEQKYVNQLDIQVKEFEKSVISNNKMSDILKDSCLNYLHDYRNLFDSVVALDKEIGIKNNTGLKLKIRNLQSNIESDFKTALFLSEQTKARLYKKIRLNFIFYTFLLISISIIFSFYISKLITKPLSELAYKVHKYVKGGFDDIGEINIKSGNKEIKTLIQNFSLLKSELNDLIFDFKSKVNERTKEISEKNNKLELQKEEIKSQNEHLQSQNIVIEIQRQNLEEQNNNLTSSIRYARQLQDALTPDIANLSDVFSESFVLNKPKEIVSGDFYWFKKIRNENYDLTLLSVADCTGHGVSGAMMSMLAIALLNEIVYRKSIKTSNQVLDELRVQIKKSLRQTGKRFERQDGLDIAFCVIDNKTKQLSFSGAYNPLWIFRQLPAVSDNNLLYDFIEIRGDKQPIGIYPSETPFTENKIQLFENDILYLFSDGFHSQMNADGNRKLKKNDMKNMISSIIHKPLIEQKRLLETQFCDWKGNFEQIDDVLVLSVKI